MTEFTPLMSFAGGLMIGLSAVALMYFCGRIAGMTAILGGILPPLDRDWAWKATFLAGAVLAPAILAISGIRLDFASPVPVYAVIVGGVVTGIGVTFGSGCTSGHGICGLARFSKRSAAATLTFMAFAFLTTFVVRHIFGGF
ncbi:putative membrane protein YedE/YeeE [Rhizobium aquaticum]|uniref:Membrane protein YedE/YeeE n=1 Tax=Rhizobium aquaticum TaxID=1549636 RepID=A0ABV2J4L0_9HYPH